MALATAAVAVACGRQLSLDELQRYQSTSLLGGEADTAPTWSPTTRDPVTISISVPTQAAPRGTPIPIRVRLHNGGTRPVSVGLGQNEDVEVVVARVDKPARQGSLFGPPPPPQQYRRAAVVTDPIRAGRDSVFEVLWPQTDDVGHRVPAGQYRLRAVVNAELLSSRRLWTDWATVVVAP